VIGRPAAFFRFMKTARVLEAPALDALLARALLRKIVDIYALAYGPGTIGEQEVVRTWQATATHSSRRLIRHEARKSPCRMNPYTSPLRPAGLYSALHHRKATRHFVCFKSNH
jgi:hypothetical protein